LRSGRNSHGVGFGGLRTTPLESYPLGYSECEGKRLVQQAATLEDMTEDLLRRAGLSGRLIVRRPGTPSVM
jgi:hypothetical protein